MICGMHYSIQYIHFHDCFGNRYSSFNIILIVNDNFVVAEGIILTSTNYTYQKYQALNKSKGRRGRDPLKVPGT